MDVEAVSAKPRLRLLLDRFAKIKDTRQGWNVAYPQREVLFLVVCGTIASGDDYEDVAWGTSAHPAQLFRVPLRHSLRRLAARGDEPHQSGAVPGCFTSWVAQCWPDKLELVAIDGKTSRGSHNRKLRRPASGVAFATNSRLVLGQEAVAEKSNEITAIPA